MKKNIMFITILILMLTTVVLFSVIKKKSVKISEENSSTEIYRKITSEEAAQIMANEKNYIIVDVRTQNEYMEGHIPNAVSIPLNTIGDSEIRELPDKNQLIMVYCRSGSRSRQAVLKLIKKGYTNVIDFGGINSWTGEIIK
ncbi:rhodanese-like domain-containing protein [Leptotrichia sp. OH3620_COT-345]|uniref:rhodanese-like domain-containing protein n=1 Tax=Leptotrichia sp. OH3620_COT-345 TaxID=2491048 RepID=UPI000F6482FA|nr:rhodanese-like domain-containing protein [Leptotrichia sp. OH3620_COT-345]RRD39310.1 rhodanese-like domain-containing protein [Leptotrichia sp. OH3620_COT-345]